MNGREQIRRVIRETINQAIEGGLDFDAQTVYMMATAKAYNETNDKGAPRFGIDPQIDRYNQIASDIKKKENEEGEADVLDTKFGTPNANSSTAPTLTNMYEASTLSIQANLDKVKVVPNTGIWDDETQEAIDFGNDNINRELKGKKNPSDDASGTYPPANMSKSF